MNTYDLVGFQPEWLEPQPEKKRGRSALDLKPCPNPTYLEGPPCPRCKGRLRYAKTRACVRCQSHASRRYRTKKTHGG